MKALGLVAAARSPSSSSSIAGLPVLELRCRELAFSSKASLSESAAPGATLSCRRLTEPETVTARARPRQRLHPAPTTAFNPGYAALPPQGARHLPRCIPRFPLGWPAHRRPPRPISPITCDPSRASAERVNRDRKVRYFGARVLLAGSFHCRPNPRPLVQRWRSL